MNTPLERLPHEVIGITMPFAAVHEVRFWHLATERLVAIAVAIGVTADMARKGGFGRS